MEPAAKVVDPDDNYWKLIGDNGEAVQFDPALFCREKLQSCNFFLYPATAQKSRRADSLVTVIQGNGGAVLDEPDDHSITLLDLRYMNRHGLVITNDDVWPHDLFNSKFIYDSVMSGSIADLEQYRYTPSKYKKYDANDILMKKRGWEDLLPVGSPDEMAEVTKVGENSSHADESKRQNSHNQNIADNDPGNLELDGNRDDDSSVNGDSNESVVTDTPAVLVGKVKKVAVDENGLPLLPKVPQNNNRDGVGVAVTRRRPYCATTPTRAPITVSQKTGLNTNAKENESEGSRATPRSARKRGHAPEERADVACSSKQAQVQDRNTPQTPPVKSKSTKVVKVAGRARIISSPGSSTCSGGGEDRNLPQALACREVSVNGGRKEILASPVSPIEEIVSEDDDVNEEDFKEANNCRPVRSGRAGRPLKLKCLTKSKYLPIGTPYTLEEDIKILKTVMKNKWHANHGAVRIWEWMEQNTELSFGRTHQSLKNRFRMHILPNLRQFKLSNKQLCAFAEADERIKKGNRPKAYIPPLPKRKQ